MRILYIGNDLSKKSKYHSAFTTLKENLINEGYDVMTSSSKENQVFRLLDMIYSVFKNVLKVDYIIIDVFSTNAFYYALVTSQLARLFKTKYIAILHGGNLPIRLKKHPKLCNLIFKNSYKNVSPSSYLQSIFKHENIKTVLIPNTINIEEYNFKKRKEIKPNILFVRAFASIYNPVMAIEVLNQLKKTYSKATLCMVGPDRDGTLNDVKKRISELKLDNDVTITGVLTKQKWHELSKDYDIFINTTNVDNTPVSLIEVMALGLPIVSTNVGGIPFLMDNEIDSILVAPNDVLHMTTAVISLLKNSKLTEQISDKGRKKSKRMDWESVNKEWIKILN